MGRPGLKISVQRNDFVTDTEEVGLRLCMTQGRTIRDDLNNLIAPDSFEHEKSPKSLV